MDLNLDEHPELEGMTQDQAFSAIKKKSQRLKMQEGQSYVDMNGNPSNNMDVNSNSHITGTSNNPFQPEQ